MPRFRVVIVGAGPVGLAAGHALTVAGIDWVMLERRHEVADQTIGANLALWPHSLRILDQFGLLEKALQLGVPMKYKKSLDASGREVFSSNMFELVQQNHGHPWLLFHRARLLQLLHETLPGRDIRVKTDKEVTFIESLPHGVRVHCADQSIEEGSIVLACDGVHGRTRTLVREMALKAGFTNTIPATPMAAKYLAFLAYLPALDGLDRLEPETVYETREKDYSFTVLRRHEDAYLVVYMRLPDSAREYRRYDSEDAQAFVDQIWNHPVGQDYLVQDLWPSVRWTQLVHLEEGALPRWHWDRVVFAGDSVCKMTPNAGLGLNTGLQGVVELVNHLQEALAYDPDPSTGELESVFRQYQKDRQGLANRTKWLSGVYTRVVAWPNWFYRALCTLAPYIGGDAFMIKWSASPIIKQGVVLHYVEERGFKEGSVPWVNRPLQKGEMA